VKDRCDISEEIIGIADVGTDVCADDVSSWSQLLAEVGRRDDESMSFTDAGTDV
jgi:hypothetical protein